MELAGQAHCEGLPILVPQDESCAWAWLPLGARDSFAGRTMRSGASGADLGTRFALGAPGAGLAGFRRTHRQAVGARAVALAAGPSGQRLTSFAEVAPLALIASSVELLWAWVHETLGPLATDDDHYARLRDTLRVFLQENGSTRTVSSTGSARPKTPSGIPWASAACRSSWPSWQANGSASPSCIGRGSPSHDGPARSSQPRSFSHTPQPSA
jgi:hypothetical protein